MRRQDFHFELPEELIAQRPLPDRADSRLLVLERDSPDLADAQFRALPEWLRPGDLLIFNDTRVIPARLYGTKETGGRVEVLIERLLSDHLARAQVRASKAPKPGSTLHIGDGNLEVMDRDGGFFELRCGPPGFAALMARHGHMPLPPYIAREDDAADQDRYQTVYARQPGAVAAPTAGLHFDQNLMRGLVDRGVDIDYLTLHVGAGTFQPMRVDDISEHKMHSERVTITRDLCDRIAATRQSGGRVIAVGTTTLRSLESAWKDGAVRPFDGETEIFIYPGVDIRSIDGLITNFHLPESTLLMLVAALVGTDRILAAYRHAVDQRYRFFSYGDAMLIL